MTDSNDSTVQSKANTAHLQHTLSCGIGVKVGIVNFSHNLHIVHDDLAEKQIGLIGEGGGVVEWLTQNAS